MPKKFLTLDQQNPIQYRETVYSSAKPDIENIVNRFGLSGKTILSIGSGYGAEEDLFAEMGCKMICIEPDRTAYSVHMKFKSPDIKLYHMTLREYLKTPDEDIDVVYTSGDTTWSGALPLHGIPSQYLELFSVVKPKFFIAKLYAVNFRTSILKSGTFLAKLKSQVPVKEYWLSDNTFGDKNASILVAFGEKVADIPLTYNRGGLRINLHSPKNSLAEEARFIFNVFYWQFKKFVNRHRRIDNRKSS